MHQRVSEVQSGVLGRKNQRPGVRVGGSGEKLAREERWVCVRCNVRDLVRSHKTRQLKGQAVKGSVGAALGFGQLEGMGSSGLRSVEWDARGGSEKLVERISAWEVQSGGGGKKIEAWKRGNRRTIFSSITTYHYN